jgi:hypothetical protein
MIQPGRAPLEIKFLRNPLEIFLYTPQKIIPLLPTGAAVGYKKRGRRMNQQEASKRGYAFEESVLSVYGGEKHCQFLNGKRVKKGATIIDVLTKEDGDDLAIECKSVNPYIDGEFYIYPFYKIAYVLKEQILKRNIHLPKTIKQRVVFEDFGFTEEQREEIAYTVFNIFERFNVSATIQFYEVASC